jgi:membrane protease YdiL (CAAX protease family)
METEKISLKTFYLSIIAIILVESGFRLALNDRGAAALPALGLLRTVEGVLLVAIALVFEKDASAVGLLPSRMLSGLIRGLIWSVFFGTGAIGLYLILLAMGIDGLKLLQGIRISSGAHLAFLFLVGGIVGPIAEELFFRGIIYGYLRRWGAPAAVLMSTLLFVLIHPSGTGLPVTQTIGGLVFAVAYEKEQNLIVPITIHCLGNLTIFGLSIYLG